MLALGFFLARRRVSVVVALAIVALVAMGLAATAAAMAARGRVTAAALPHVSSAILAWLPGVLLAFSAALHALAHDARDGIVDLVLGRGVSLRAYAIGRVSSLAALLFLANGAGVLLVTVAAAIGARTWPLGVASLHAGVAGLAHAVAFSLVMAPLTLATLGVRSRALGYLAFVGILAGPELVRLSVRDLPSEWTELFSIPSAMSAMSRALSPGRVDVGRALAAALVLAIVSLLLTTLATKHVSRLARTRAGAS